MVSTRGSLLGKRSQSENDSTLCDQLQTPEPTPKRLKTTVTVLDGDQNKENIPPLNLTPVNDAQASPPTSSRAARALRRNATEPFITPPPRVRAALHSLRPFRISRLPHRLLHLSLYCPSTARVRALFRATCNDMVSMPSRENERDIITEFLITFLSRSDAISFPSLYISGSPGCGKTTLINSILDSMANELGETKIINVNCMSLNNIDALWDRLIDEFDGVLQKKRKSGTRKAKGRDSVESMLEGMSARCVLVLDEMDHIASNPQSISSLLNLAKSERLCVVGIANTHTLTSSLSSSSHIGTLHFSPYTSAQLLQILQSRLATLSSPGQASIPDADMKQFLPVAAMTLLTKKVAALTGDVRTLFEVLRGAIDMAVSSASAATTSKVDDESFFANAGPVCSVTPAHVLAALKSSTSSNRGASFTPHAPATSNSGIVSKVAELGLQARLVLLSILAATKRVEAGLTIELRNSSSSSSITPESSSASIDGAHLHTYYSHILRRGGDSLSTPVSRSEFSDLLGLLEGVGLLALSSSQTSPKKKKMRFGRSASFGAGLGAGGRSSGGMSEDVRLASGVWADEVLRGLGVTASSSLDADVNCVRDVKEEELCAIWMRENVALRKELKAIEAKRNARSKEGMFVDASLDE
ncbi:P-loop containing nucleoside triphosphate hydrolase protein [Gymnopus androsaceus JB14]|uniref:P-loop containing nucleoside triphosphate hydrolase protein n=1 Tax=Gymnopus androsaceus JB14 TaxID=1447944 RepID=A0A6A4IHE3_9AGAR|nr:P-loop containing nucleoside triphosphate hydrolase protein [Gymnopus androsaceus JB14]